MNKINIYNRIVKLICGHNLSSISDITETTRLYHDLKISGDDAREILKEIEDEFNIAFDIDYISKRFPTEVNETSFTFFIRRMFAHQDTYIATSANDLANYVQECLRKGDKNTS